MSYALGSKTEEVMARRTAWVQILVPSLELCRWCCTTQIGTGTHCFLFLFLFLFFGIHCFLIQITHLVSGLPEVQVLYVSAQK